MLEQPPRLIIENTLPDTVTSIAIRLVDNASLTAARIKYADRVVEISECNTLGSRGVTEPRNLSSYPRLQRLFLMEIFQPWTVVN